MLAQGVDNHAILDRLLIRRMTGDEVAFTIDLAAGEGWNPGIHDGACFYATDPAGFFVAELDGELVGSISAVSYDDSFGFIGLYIVKPKFRGIGIGTRLWGEGMAYLTDHNIGPLFADNEHIAEIFFRALKSNVPGEPVFFDTPEVNPKAAQKNSSGQCRNGKKGNKLYSFRAFTGTGREDVRNRGNRLSHHLWLL